MNCLTCRKKEVLPGYEECLDCLRFARVCFYTSREKCGASGCFGGFEMIDGFVADDFKVLCSIALREGYDYVQKQGGKRRVRLKASP